MNEIKCPHCGTVFQVDESGFADIVKQVRDAEFNREIERREKLFAEQREQAVALAGEKVRGEARDEIASRDAEIAKLTQSLAAIKRENDAASRAAQAEQIAALSKVTASKDAEIAELKSKLARLADERASDARVTEADHKRALADATASRDAKIAELTQKLEAQKTTFATEKELAVTQARTQVERERDDTGDKTAEIDKAEYRDARDRYDAEQTEVYDRQLHEHRGRTEHGYVRARNGLNDFVPAQTHQRQQHCGNDRKTDGDDSEQQRILYALHKENSVLRQE